ncbi:MAG: protein kinase [Deltaproteobacteria bacterium]|nr:protein kinase [Deltaproteobacteria bacterium]
MEATSPTAVGGEIASRFVITGELEQRPTATVYRAQDKVLGNREVVVKVFNEGPGNAAELTKAFEEEVNKIRSASHPALVPLIAGGVDRGKFYLAMELIAGQTLRDLLKEKGGALAIDAAVGAVAELAGGLGELHEQKLTHGHLDTRAILFKGNEPRLAGYVPRSVDQVMKQSTSAGRLVAEAYYISPEQLSSGDQIDGRADIYSLSTILFEMVTGQRPFSATNPMQAAMQRITENPAQPSKINSAISPLLEAAILKGLARDPKNRFQNCNEFVEALNASSGVTKNPFVGMAQNQPERMTTSTIAVSMSSDTIRQMLKSQESKAAAPSGAVNDTVNATAMGMKAVTGPSASLIVMTGAERGKRITLNKPVTMVGSDSGCDVVIDGKGVPARYALISQKDGAYFAGALSGTPLKVNGEVVKGDDRKLERGDILNVGDDEIRFAAPGEVFTLRDDVADRVVDRPKSKAGPILLVLVCLVAAVAGGAFYLYQQKRQALELARAKTEVQKTKEREAIINRLRQEGDELLKAGALREPIGANAYERFRTILDYNPEDTYAKRRISEIDERVGRLQDEEDRRKQMATKLTELLADGERYYISKQYVSPPGRNARESYQEVLKFDPENKTARARIGEIDTILGDMIGRVRETLAQAKAYKEMGQYIDPPGANAYELVRQVLDADPKNSEAQNLILDMAAMSIFKGNSAKAKASLQEMKRAYLTAESLGVDPGYTDLLMRGTDLMKKSRKGAIFIYGSGTDEKDLPKDSPQYLATSELHKRVARISRDVDSGVKPGDKMFIEMSK